MPQRATPPQRTRVDWGAAKAFYAGLRPEERSYPIVAREFRVSVTTVRKWARRDGWAEAATEADRRAAAAALAQSTRSREQMAAQTARLRAKSGDVLEAKLEQPDALDGHVIVRLFDVSDRQYRLDLGEATDRIAVGDVEELVTVLTALAREFVDDLTGTVQERRVRFLGRLDEVRPLQAVAA